MSSMSFPSNGRVVESQSVQGQFAALTKDRDTLRWQVDASDRQRRGQEAQLKELRDLQSQLQQQLQAAHASLGNFQKKKALLANERTRLFDLLKAEKQQLETSQETLQELVSKQKQAKQSFLQEMEEWNQELDGLLTQSEDMEWKRLVCTSTIAMVSSSVGEETTMLWQEAVEKLQQEQEVHKLLVQEIEQWRIKAQKERSDLDWIDLERVWQEETSLNDIGGALFYGQSLSQESTHENQNHAMSMDEDSHHMTPQDDETNLVNESIPVM